MIWALLVPLALFGSGMALGLLMARPRGYQPRGPAPARMQPPPGATAAVRMPPGLRLVVRWDSDGPLSVGSTRRPDTPHPRHPPPPKPRK